MPVFGEWSGEDVSIAQVEHAIANLRHAEQEDRAHGLRTTMLTHIAWVPPDWEQQAAEVRAGLGGRQPSRVIVLRPDPDADADRIDAHVALECFDLPEIERGVSAEVIELRLLGRLCVAPASVVAPLLMADLPVFIRWRGRPPFAGETFEQLLHVIDRLVVDSVEWPDVPEAYAELARIFDEAACSDIAWRRTHRWRVALAGLWPEIAEISELNVTGPVAEAYLLAGWLRSRLDREVELVHADADTVVEVHADGRRAVPTHDDAATPSDLLSAELDVLERDRVYEAAAVAAAALTPLAA
jgi:hypothetical protein